MSPLPTTNVLFCTWGYPPGKSGGAEHQARLQAEELQRRGYSVTVVCPRRDATGSGEVDGVRVCRLPSLGLPRGSAMLYLLCLACFLLWNLRRVKIVHVHLTREQLVVACACARVWGRPIYAKPARGGKGGDVGYLVDRWLGRQFVIQRPVTWQAISDEIVNELLAAGVAEARIVRIPNGVKLRNPRSLSASERLQLRARLDLPADAVIVLFVGRFVRQKGRDVLLEAWAGVDRSEASLVCVGYRTSDGPESATQTRSYSPAVVSNVIARPWTEAVDDYYAASDVFVLPSRGEGMSNALLEAMAFGLPVVATRVGAAASMIEDRVSGWLVSPEDPVQLREALRALCLDAALRRSLGGRASLTISNTYSVETVVDRIEAVYGAMLE
jgi:glycosyltransferase involved in cell wall biosynthesis